MVLTNKTIISFSIASDEDIEKLKAFEKNHNVDEWEISNTSEMITYTKSVSMLINNDFLTSNK